MEEKIYITYECDPLYPQDSITITNFWYSYEEATNYMKFVRENYPDIGIQCFEAKEILC